MYYVNTLHSGFYRKIYTTYYYTYIVRCMHLFLIFKTLNGKRLIFLANILADKKFMNSELQFIIFEIRFCRCCKVLKVKTPLDAFLMYVR